MAANAGQQQKQMRWKQCVSNSITSLKLASGALYVRKYFTKEDKSETLAMIEQLLIAFKEMINESDWMDALTKKIAIEKVDAMKSVVGYPDFILKTTALDEIYREVQRVF